MAEWIWTAGALMAVLTAIAIVATVAALLLLRDHGRLARHAADLARSQEALNDRLWKVADSEEHFRSLVEALGDVIVRRNTTGKILYANAAYAALMGAEAQALIGTDRRLDSRHSGAVETRADGARMFDECLWADGSERWMSWVETVVPQPNGELAIQRIGRDVTARVASARALDEARTKAEDASEAKSRFLATVSHEFRTPLNGILGMADLLDDTGPTQEQDTYVRALRTSGEALLALVDDILDFAKVEAGKLELAEAPFDLPLLVESVIELMAPRAQAKGIELSACMAPDLPLRVLGDADRLRQVLLNIVGNAVKFTQQGGVGVTLSRADEQILVEVSDTGPGIAADRLEAIFEEFEQADNNAMPHPGGTGLGLAIVRRLVTLMGGTVSVESQPGHGAIFRLVLPLVTLSSEGTQPEMPDWRGRKVLVISGMPFLPGHLQQMLQLTGANVLLAKDQAEAMPLLAANPDAMVALIDHSLGANVARELARRASEQGRIRSIILLSPQERRSLGSPASAGFDGFLVKPLRARSLYQRLGGTEATPLAMRAAPVASTSAPAPKLRVLVAEDNEINALLMTRTLERLGCLPVWARDGREALLLAEASLSGMQPAFDLVLMDVRMPGLDGLSASRLIRAAEQAAGASSRLTILAVSANVAETDRRAALAAGMDDCLGKPLTRETLSRWIDDLAKLRNVA